MKRNLPNSLPRFRIKNGYYTRRSRGQIFPSKPNVTLVLINSRFSAAGIAIKFNIPCRVPNYSRLEGQRCSSSNGGRDNYFVLATLSPLPQYFAIEPRSRGVREWHVVVGCD